MSFRSGDKVKDKQGKTWRVQGSAGNGSLMLKRGKKTATKYRGLLKKVK
jgi:hypothetical protein